jgi:hypothetical protein
MIRIQNARHLIVVVLLWCAPPLYAAQIYLDPLYGWSLQSDVVYGTGKVNFGTSTKQLKMDIYQPVDIGKAPVLANRPAVVIQDGGAWTSGSKTNGRVTTAAKYMAQHGYTVFVTDYRQVGDFPSAGPGPWQSLNPGGNGSLFGASWSVYPTLTVVRAGIEDFSVAISHVRNNAALYGIDPNRIGAAGGSSGGINVLDLQYNGVTPAAYKAQAVIALVATMAGDWDKVVAGGPPLFMLNNVNDPLIWYSPDVEPNLHNRLKLTGIYYEQWWQYPNTGDHNIHYDQYPSADPTCPWLTAKVGDTSELVLDRIRDFLAYKLAGGPIPLVIPEPASVVLALIGIGFVAVWISPLRKRL